jgi:ferritin-like metal-binding protein YciE
MDTAGKKLENIEVNFENVRPIRHKFDGESGLRDLLFNELKSVYYVEKALLKVFPKIIKNSCSIELIEALTIHQQETKLQVIRLEDAFSWLNENPVLERCLAIESLLETIDVIIEDTKFGIVRDGGIVLGMTRIEHYEIATYSMLATFAENLEEHSIAALLSETVNEEKVAQLRLAKIAHTIRFYTKESLL